MPTVEQEHTGEDRGESYYQAARFTGERPAGRAYQRAQQLIYDNPCELSAFRLELNRIWHVAVVGETPTTELDRRLRLALAGGKVVQLPGDILQLLFERRAQITPHTPWMEGHYTTGESF